MGMGKFNQMTIIPTNVDKTPLEEVEYPSQSTKESEMRPWVKSQEKEWSQFVSKANHSTSQKSRSMLYIVTLLI